MFILSILKCLMALKLGESILEEAVLAGSADCSVWETLLPVTLNIEGQNVVGPWLPWERVSNDRNSQSVQPPATSAAGPRQNMAVPFNLSPVLYWRFVRQPSESPVAWRVCDVLQRKCSRVMWWKFGGVGHQQSRAEMGRSPEQMNQNAQLSWKVRDGA